MNQGMQLSTLIKSNLWPLNWQSPKCFCELEAASNVHKVSLDRNYLLFSPLQYSLKEIHLHWNVPTSNTFLRNVLFRILLSTLVGHPQCYFWKHCDTTLKTMSKNKLLLSCHLLFTKVMAFFREVFLDILILWV